MTDRIKTAIAKKNFLISEYCLRLIKKSFYSLLRNNEQKGYELCKKNDFCLHFLLFLVQNAWNIEKIKGRNLLILNKNA